ncbi:MAG: hypothetical protein GY854_08305 [Deltaproteobacteria bacterium]|nr:hypothetical protein [Deltaproteobacteria bacterium]
MLKVYRCCLKWAVVVCLTSVVVFGCGGKEKKETKSADNVVAAGPKGPDYQVFAPLPKATTVAELPYLVGPDGEDNTPCFKPGEGLVPEDAGFEIKSAIEENASIVNEAIRNWFVEGLEVTGLSGALASKWEIKVEDPMIIMVPNEAVRFVDDPQCIQPSRGWLGEDIHAVTMLIGARTFSFTTSVPVDMDIQEEMVGAVSQENFILESDALFVYEPATDDTGKPITNQEGEPLYKAPDGRFIPDKEVPPPEKRTMKEWTIKGEIPLYFAFRELSDEAWRKESKKDLCDVFLVWGDITPRAPECEEFTESAFVATKTEDDEVAITITTGGENKGVTLGFGDSDMVMLNDRIIIWLSPKKIEEGVKLRLNSLVLNPQGISAMSRKSERETYVPTKAAPIDDEKPEPKKKKKKGKPKSDKDALDSFLND